MQEERIKYKYVVISYGYDYYEYVYRQFIDCKYAKYIHEIRFPRIVESLFFRLITNKYFPFKEIWSKLYLHYIENSVADFVSKTDKLCFVLLAGGKNNALLDCGLIEKLRLKYKGSKIVYFINDLVSKTNQPVLLMKDKADIVITFDPRDAKTYGLKNHIIPYSDFNFAKAEEQYDIAFVGAAKDRLDELIYIHKYLINNGIKSYFHIINVPKEKRVPIPGVTYSGFISYKENIDILSKSRCLIDIVQKEGTGNTIRVGEAIIMEKKLLTNNIHTPTNGVYDEKYMQVFTDCTDINLDFIRDPATPIYTIKERMYPINLLYFIEMNLRNE